jgi:hypothetical protein
MHTQRMNKPLPTVCVYASIIGKKIECICCECESVRQITYTQTHTHTQNEQAFANGVCVCVYASITRKKIRVHIQQLCNVTMIVQCFHGDVVS